jgi:hypothetical protein
MTKAGNRLLDAAREVSAIARGEAKPAQELRKEAADTTPPDEKIAAYR